MRALQGSIGAFSYAVSEFLRVSGEAIPARVFTREVPELADRSTGLPVQVQILGGDPDRMALSALAACQAGARAIDLNFGCPAPTVNRHDGGATLLKEPERIRAVVRAVRQALPAHVPVSAKLRLGWESPGEIHHNAAMAAEGGASWLTIHARTRLQGYAPPVLWKPIGQVHSALGLCIIANGDIFSLDDFRRCRDETGCLHFMLGRGALANPSLSHQIARELGLPGCESDWDWCSLMQQLVTHMRALLGHSARLSLKRLKQWLKLAALHGDFAHFDRVKRCETLDELYGVLAGTPRVATKLPG